MVCPWLEEAMKRRDFIKALGGGAATWPLAAQAQRIAVPVIGYLAAGNQNSESRLVDAFVKGLREAGYEDGRNTDGQTISMIDCHRWRRIWCVER